MTEENDVFATLSWPEYLENAESTGEQVSTSSSEELSSEDREDRELIVSDSESLPESSGADWPRAFLLGMSSPKR